MAVEGRLPVTVLGATTVTEYQGTMYEQTVHVRLQDGSEIDFFDGT